MSVPTTQARRLALAPIEPAGCISRLWMSNDTARIGVGMVCVSNAVITPHRRPILTPILGGHLPR